MTHCRFTGQHTDGKKKCRIRVILALLMRNLITLILNICSGPDVQYNIPTENRKAQADHVGLSGFEVVHSFGP